MAPRSSKSKAAPPVQPNLAVQCLESSDKQPPQLFILPKRASPAARIVSLANPGTSKLNRYYYCPETGLYEFTKIDSPRNTPRSWLLARSQKAEKSAKDGCITQDENTPLTRNAERCLTPTEQGYVLQDADMFVATPLDPVFLWMPVVPVGVAAEQEARYRLEDDYIDTLAGSSKHMAQLLQEDSFRQLLVQRLRAISHTKNVGETVYKLEPNLLLDELIRKAGQMITGNAWPASLEEKYIRAQLQAPTAIIPREDAQADASENDATIASNSEVDTLEVFAESQIKSPSTIPQSVDTLQDMDSGKLPDPDFARYSIPKATVDLLRLRVSLDFLLCSYVPKALREYLRKLLDSNRIVDFNPINQHIEHLQKLRSEVQALRSLSDNISRKRNAADDDEAAEIRAEKKRRKEEEEKKKKAETRASKDLRKVDTTGMKKLSSFFSKATPAQEKEVKA